MTDDDRIAELLSIRDRQTKVCTGCAKERPRSEFRARRGNRDGLVARCKACESGWHRAYYLAHREEILDRSRDWYEENRESRSEKRAAWYRANRDHAYAKNREWVANNREAYTEYQRVRRARIRQVTVGPVDLDALWTGFCALCDESMDRDLRFPHPESKSIDHIVPVARGGTHEQSNLQWAHLNCNQVKGVRLFDAEGVRYGRAS